MSLQGQRQALAYVGVAHEVGSVSVQTWPLVLQSVSQCHVCNWKQDTGSGREARMCVGILLSRVCLWGEVGVAMEVLPWHWKKDDCDHVLMGCNCLCPRPDLASSECRDLSSSVSVYHQSSILQAILG